MPSLRVFEFRLNSDADRSALSFLFAHLGVRIRSQCCSDNAAMSSADFLVAASGHVGRASPPKIHEKLMDRSAC